MHLSHPSTPLAHRRQRTVDILVWRGARLNGLSLARTSQISRHVKMRQTAATRRKLIYFLSHFRIGRARFLGEWPFLRMQIASLQSAAQFDRKVNSQLSLIASYKPSTLLRCRCLLSRDIIRLGKWFVQPSLEKNAGKR